MQIQFDPAKDVINRAKHGIPLGDAALVDWETTAVWPDTRFDYDEARMNALGYIGARLHAITFVDRGSIRRIINLRKANKREEKRYACT